MGCQSEIGKWQYGESTMCAVCWSLFVVSFQSGNEIGNKEIGNTEIRNKENRNIEIRLIEIGNEEIGNIEL